MVPTMYWRRLVILYVTVPWFESSYLNAVVTVRKVVHSLELLVDDTNARLVSAVGDLLDILGALPQGLELLVDNLGSFNGGLRVEFGYSIINIHKDHA